jgi:hypothetical protein
MREKEEIKMWYSKEEEEKESLSLTHTRICM